MYHAFCLSIPPAIYCAWLTTRNAARYCDSVVSHISCSYSGKLCILYQEVPNTYQLVPTQLSISIQA